MSGKFELYRDVHDRYRFRLISENGELVLSGDGYTQKVLALDAIVSIMRSASEAAVIDLSLPEGSEIPEDELNLWEEEQMEDASDRRPRGKKRKRKDGAGNGKRRKSGKKSKHGKKKGKRK